MRILVVGAGGVGAAIAAIARAAGLLRPHGARRRRCCSAPNARSPDSTTAAASPRRASTRRTPTSVAALAREVGADVVRQRLRPAPEPADLRRGVRRRHHLPGHGDAPLEAHIRERPYEETGVKLGDAQFAVADRWEAQGQLALVGHRRRARALGRLRPLRRRPPLLVDRRGRHPRRREPRHRRATTSRRRSRSGPRSRSASTRR